MSLLLGFSPVGLCDYTPNSNSSLKSRSQYSGKKGESTLKKILKSVETTSASGQDGVKEIKFFLDN
jgi:hypothetical protein